MSGIVTEAARIYIKKSIYFLIFALLTAISSNAVAFDVNVSTEEILRKDGRFFVKDLTVGVPMVVDYGAFCIDGKKLAVRKNSFNSDKLEIFSTYVIVLKPNGRVDVSFPRKKNRTQYPPSMADCQISNDGVHDLPNWGVYEVDEIEGSKSLSGFLKVYGEFYDKNGDLIENSQKSKPNKPSVNEETIKSILDDALAVTKPLNDFQSDRLAVQNWGSEIRKAVSRGFSYNLPSSVQKRGKIEFTFEFDKDGKIKETTISQTSGYPEFDEVALKAAKKTAFPRAPQNIKNKERKFSVVVNFSQ